MTCNDNGLYAGLTIIHRSVLQQASPQSPCWVFPDLIFHRHRSEEVTDTRLPCAMTVAGSGRSPKIPDEPTFLEVAQHAVAATSNAIKPSLTVECAM